MKKNYSNYKNIIPTINRKNIFSILFFLIFSTAAVGQTSPQTFNSSGTFTVPAGVTSITVQAWGGGEDGKNDSNYGGGGGGAYAESTFNVTAGVSYAIVVGSHGNRGGNSSIAVSSSTTVLIVKAEGGGQNSYHQGGRVSGSIGTIKYSGGDGHRSNTYYGGGGGSAGTTGNGSNANNASGGNGGSGTSGDGGNGSSNNPGDGSNPGGGGGEGRNSSGDGGNGRVIISWVSCPTYSLTGVTATESCASPGTSNITVTGSATGLPIGTYTVEYRLSYDSYSTVYTASMSVTTAGSGSFTANVGIVNVTSSTKVRIDKLTLGSCTSNLISNNESNISYKRVTLGKPGVQSGFSFCSIWKAQWSNMSSDGYYLDVATTNTFSSGTFLAGYNNLPIVGYPSSYDITGLTPGNTYYYRVRSYNYCGTSVNSNVITFVAAGAVAPTVGTITQPTCSTPTGSFTITNYVSWHTYTISPSSGVSISGAVVTAPAGTYTITDTNSGCTSTATSFTINAQPISSVAPTGITGTNTICSGDSTTLILTGGTAAGGTAKWYSGSCGGTLVGTGNSITVSPTSTTTYYVRYEGGCNTTTCASRTVTVSAFPTASNAGPDQSLVNATSFTLAANTPTVGTGVWTIVSGPSLLSTQFSSTTSPTAAFTPAVGGTYVLSWKISNSCSSSEDQVVVSNNCVTNLISNGDFSGDITGWTFATIQGDRVEVNPENTYFSNSSNSLTAELDSEASLRQVISVIPGVSYTVSFRYARRPTTGTPTTTGVTVRVTGGAPTTSPGLTTTNTTPKIGSFTFTPTTTSVGIEFYNHLNGGITLGTIIDDIVLLPTSQATPYAVTTPKGDFNTSASCAGVAVQLDVENVPASGVTYVWTGTTGAVFSATNIKNPTITFTGSGIQQATVTVTIAAGCSVTSTTYINVAAAPVITAPIASSVCSGDTYFSGAITSTGTTFDWSRAAVAGINGSIAGIGGNNIANTTGFSEILTNSTSNPINVTYVLIPKSTSIICAGIPYNLVVTVNPKNTAPTGTPIQPTCSVSTGSIVLNGLPSTGTIVQKLGAVTTNYTITGGGTQDITNLNPGNYTFAVSNGSCSSTTLNITINNPPAVIKWNGTTWSGTPTINNRVEFNASYSSGSNANSPSNVDACSCYITNNAVVTFNSGHTLKVVNEVQVVAGTLTFENDASLVQVNDLANNSGSINYKRYTKPVKRYDFTYWSSPVLGQTLKKLSPNTLGDKYYGFVNNAWVIYYNGAATMAAGNGYLIRAPQTFSTTVAAIDVNPMFVGKPNNGVLSFSIAGNRSHLLGNPYPSAMDADTFLDANSAVLEGTLYFWTHNSPPSIAVAGDAKYNYTANDYATYNRTGGVGTAPAKTDSDTNDPNDNNNLSIPTGKIAAGQGFFAPSTMAGGTVLFNNSMRIVGGASGVNNSQFFKLSTTAKESPTTVATREKNRVWLNLTNKEGAFKQTLVGYITGATNDYDAGFDGVTYDGNQFLDFYSVNNAVNLSIQARALPFVKKDSVALGYKSTIKGDFQISIDHTDGVLSTQNVFLEDKDLKVLHDLKKEPYTFSTEKGAFNNRFVLRYVDKNAVEEVVPEIPQVPEDLNKEVLVSVQNGVITINSPVELLDKVVVYDSAGRKLFQKNKVEVNVFFIQHLISSHQVLLVDILLSNGTKLSRKIVY